MDIIIENKEIEAINENHQVNWEIIATSNNPTPRFDNTLEYYNNFIYSYGGSESSTGNKGFQSFLRLDLTTFHWQILSCPIKTRVAHTSVLHGNCMYVFGGGIYEDVKTGTFFSSTTRKIFKSLNELWVFNLETNTCNQMLSNEIMRATVPSAAAIADSANNPEPRDGHCAVVVDDDMYILGGSQTTTNGYPTTSITFTNVKIYNITSNTWREISSPTLGRLGSAVVYKHLNGSSCIYHFGGYGLDNKPTSDLWKYDISNDKWSLIKNVNSITNIPVARYGHSVNLYQDKMLIYGGFSKNNGFLRDFYSFDFEKGQWKQITTEGPTKRGRHRTVLINDYKETGKTKLFLYGGSYQTCLYNDLWEYSFPDPIIIPHDDLSNDFTSLFKNAKQHFSDICFSVQGNDIHAHKCILSIRSSYFSSLFKSGLKESFQSNIQINENYQDFKLFIEFLYTGNEKLVQLDNCIGILYLADLYCVPRLKVICESIAIQGISNESVVNIFVEADKFKLHQTRKLSLNYIIRNYKDLIKQGMLNQLSQNILNEIIGYINK